MSSSQTCTIVPVPFSPFFYSFTKRNIRFMAISENLQLNISIYFIISQGLTRFKRSKIEKTLYFGYLLINFLYNHIYKFIIYIITNLTIYKSLWLVYRNYKVYIRLTSECIEHSSQQKPAGYLGMLILSNLFPKTRNDHKLTKTEVL